MEGRAVTARTGGKSCDNREEDNHAEMHSEDADFSDLPVHFQPLEADANVHSGVDRAHGRLMDTDPRYLTGNYSSSRSLPPGPHSRPSSQPAVYPNSYTSPPPPPPHNMAYSNVISNPALYQPQNLAGDGLANSMPQYAANYHQQGSSAQNTGLYHASSSSSGINSHFDGADGGSVVAGPSGGGKSGHHSSGGVYPAMGGGGGGVVPARELGPHSSKAKLCSAGVNTVESGSFGPNGQNDKQYHPCPYCSKLFTRRDHMKRHVKIHIRGDPVKCVVCQSWFPCKTDLTHHLLDTHRVLVFECNGCSKGFFQAKYLTEHLRNKHDLISEGPDGSGKMIRSPTSELPPLPKPLQLPYRCGICSLSFVHEGALDKHMLCHSKRVPISTSTINTSLNSSTVPPLTPGSLTEVRDSQVMAQVWGGGQGPSDLMSMQAEYGNSMGMGLPAFPQNDMVKAEPSSEGGGEKGSLNNGHNNNNMNDMILNRALQQQQQEMAMRMMQCVGSDDYTCGVCGSVFLKAQDLKSHLRKHGSAHHRYSCEQCGASFASSSNLVRHQRTHSGEKPFKCSLCPSAFTHKGALINHERIHTGEKPYVCELCDAGFARVDALTRHRRTHKEYRSIKEEGEEGEGVGSDSNFSAV